MEILNDVVDNMFHNIPGITEMAQNESLEVRTLTPET